MWEQKYFYGSILMMGCGLLLLSSAGRKQVEIQEKLEPMVLRFHVQADSNESADQTIKLKVRDALLAEIRPMLETEAFDFAEPVMDQKAGGSACLLESKRILAEHLPELTSLAQETLRQQNCQLPVRVELTKDWFPVKQYGSLILPAGEYEALRVSIGQAEGENWWCMLFPGLCFVGESYEIETEELELLQEALTLEEFRQIWQDSETQVKVKFWVWEKVEHFLQQRKHK